MQVLCCAQPTVKQLINGVFKDSSTDEWIDVTNPVCSPCLLLPMCSCTYISFSPHTDLIGPHCMRRNVPLSTQLKYALGSTKTLILDVGVYGFVLSLARSIVYLHAVSGHSSIFTGPHHSHPGPACEMKICDLSRDISYCAQVLSFSKMLQNQRLNRDVKFVICGRQSATLHSAFALSVY